MRDTLAFARLTSGQRHALCTDGFSLINAVAGSGKTTQLVALTLKMLLENPEIHLDRLAIITFTRKAGAELRERLHRAMTAEHEHDRISNPERAKLWQKWLGQLPGAPIGTIDALVQQILRRLSLEQVQGLELDPGFTVHDETRTALLICRALHQILEKPESEPGLQPELIHLHRQHDRRSLESICVQFLSSGGDGAKARVAIHALHGQLLTNATPEIFDLLTAPTYERWQAAWDLVEPAVWPSLQNAIAELANKNNRAVQKIVECAGAYRNPENTSRQKFQLVRTALFNPDGDPFTNGLGGNQPYSKAVLSLQELLEPIVKLFKGLPNFDRELPCCDAALVRQWRNAWGLLLEAVDRRFASLCARDSSYPFFLLGRMLLNQLRGKNEGQLKELGIQYLRVMVDEFQDNTQQQWEISCHLAGGSPDDPSTWKCLTLVGDPEQAIYHWRGSNPRLMMQVRTQYEQKNPAKIKTWYDSIREDYSDRESTDLEKIGLGQLNQNYRTAPQTLEKIDQASSFGMEHLLLDHVKLEPGQPDMSNIKICDYITQRNAQAEVKLLLPPESIEAGDTADQESEEQDTTTIASSKADKFNASALSMLAANLKRMHTQHGVAWKDMMVLAHSFKALLDPLQDALSAEGVPCRALVRDALWQRQEVADIIHLIRFLSDSSDNSAMVGVLLGPIGRLTHSELLLVGMLGAGGDGRRPNVESGLRWLAELFGAIDPGINQGILEATLQIWMRLPENRQKHLKALAWQLTHKNGWRNLVDRMPHHQLVRLVLSQSMAWEAMAANHSRDGSSKESFDRVARGLDHALSRMEEIESDGPLTLREMAATLTGLMDGQIPEKVDAELGPGEDLVRIMTVHVSKGLEARVVGLLVPMVGNKGNRIPLGSNLIILEQQYFRNYTPAVHGKLLGLPLFKYPNLLVEGERVFKTTSDENQTSLALARHADQLLQMQESVRLFHVAITRTEAALFVVGSCPTANCDKYRLWPQWFCEMAWPEEVKDTAIPPAPKQTANEAPRSTAGPTPRLPRLERPASLGVKKAEEFLEGNADNRVNLELAHLGLQPVVRGIPKDWLDGNVLRAKRDLPGTIVGTLVHRGFELGEDLPDEREERQLFMANMARALLKERKGDDDTEPSREQGELMAENLAQTATKILDLLHTPQGKRFQELVGSPGAAEVDFSLRLDNWLVKGRLDRLLDNGNIIDWKTDDAPIATIIDRYTLQMKIYALAFWIAEGRPEIIKTVQLAMTHHEEVMDLQFTPTNLIEFETEVRFKLNQATESMSV